LPAVLKTQFVIDQRENRLRLCRGSHLLGFGNIHRHRLFAKNSLAPLECKERHITMHVGRRGYADKIDIVAIDRLSPIGGEVANTKLAGSVLSILPLPARNRYDTRTLTRQKGGDLYPPRKPRPNYRNTYLIFHICDFTLD
jgi:hypothetical protein